MSLSSPKNNTSRIYNDKSKSKKKLIKKDSKLSLHDYTQKLYQNFFSTPNLLLLNQLKNENLTLLLQNLSPTDILILNEIFKKYFSFKQIEIAPYNSLKQEIANNKKYKSIKDNIRENKEKQIKLKEKMDKIYIGISKHLSLSNNLISLTISNFELYSKYCLLISKGLSGNKSLQTLKISNCLIQLNSFETLIKSLYNHPCISHLDLSNNNFSDKFGNIISKLITKQAQRRDQIIWSYGLRNEKPPSNYKSGLISINLSGNKLANESAEYLVKVLGTDQYLRAVYLNENKITNEFCKRFIYMMRKNMSLLTIDLRGNSGYDEFIHSRIVMKMAKNMRYLYQQYKKGEFTEEEFENFKEYIDPSFFDVDIPQEIVEFYNNNLPETSEENNEKENNNNEQIKENKIKMNNILEDEEKKEILLMNRQLSEENLMLKKQIKELKMKNTNDEKNENKNKEKENEMYKKTESDIDSYYSRVEELIGELNDIMNKIEKKQNENKSKTNDNMENNNKIKNINNNNVINNYISKEEEEKSNKKEEDNDRKILDKLLQKNNINNNNNNQNQSFPQPTHKLFEEKKGEEEKTNSNKKTKEKIQEKKQEPIPYNVMNAEPSERNKESSEENENSHYEDEEGNIYNVDDLTNEEKMLIIQQKIILQKLQEEAEARGEQFNPQEYIEFLERQAMEEEEEEDDDFKEGKGSNKLNKSF